jgi:ABC-2 type transport system permease protein
MLRIGWKDAIAYRSELVVWMLTLTLPLIMLALFRAVAAEGALGGFDAPAFTAYFLATLIVRQLASSWVVWEMNREIREGALAMRLLRPIHPLWSYLCDSVAAIPIRAIISVPIATAMLYAIEGPSGARLARDPAMLGLFCLSLALAFFIAFAFSAFTGALALYMESALGIWHVYIGLYALLSGYLVPLALFPPWLQAIAAKTPFPYMQALPVELLLGRHPMAEALVAVGKQALWTLGAWSVLLVVWKNAQKRFAAYGG